MRTVIILDFIYSNFTSWKESNFDLLLVNKGNPSWFYNPLSIYYSKSHKTSLPTITLHIQMVESLGPMILQVLSICSLKGKHKSKHFRAHGRSGIRTTGWRASLMTSHGQGAKELKFKYRSNKRPKIQKSLRRELTLSSQQEATVNSPHFLLEDLRSLAHHPRFLTVY